MNGAENRSSITEKEMLATKWAIENFRFYLNLKTYINCRPQSDGVIKKQKGFWLKQKL